MGERNPSPTDRIFILGAGGGGRTAAAAIMDCAATAGQQREVSFLDDACKFESVNGLPVRGSVTRLLTEDSLRSGASFVVAFGALYLKRRASLYGEMKELGCHFINAVHPSCIIHSSVAMGQGNIMAPNCVIMPNATIGNNCFICTCTSIDHDSTISDHVYMSPGVRMAGGVHVGQGVFIGTGAILLPGVRLGDGAVIGAGAVVTKNVDPGVTVVGVPARVHTKV